MILSIEYSRQFKKDFKKVAQGDLLHIIEVGNVIGQLQRSETLAEKHLNHQLTGNWLGYFECHIKPDLLLIYKLTDEKLNLARLGSHAELF